MNSLRNRGYLEEGQYQVSIGPDDDLEDKTGELMKMIRAAIHGGIRRVLAQNGMSPSVIGKVDRYLDAKEGKFMDDLTDIMLKMRVPHRLG